MKKLSEISDGLQHIGLITSDLEQTVKFYADLGFEVYWRTDVNEHVVFLRLHNLMIEAFSKEDAPTAEGPWCHICLNVNDIDETFTWAKERELTLLDREIQFRPFFEKGVRFFMILGPNQEKIEFNQILS